MVKMCSGALIVSVSAMAAVAAPPPGGVTDSPPMNIGESETNNTFGQRDNFTGSAECRWQSSYFARLGPHDTGHPDTVLGFYNIIGLAEDRPSGGEAFEQASRNEYSEQAEAEALAWREAALAEQAGERGTFVSNDDGGLYRRWGGSQLTFLREGPFGSGIRVTGKGCDPLNFSVPFNCTHNQTGCYEVIINWFNADGQFIGRTVFSATLSNNDVDEFPVNPPSGTFDFDVFTKPLCDYTGDVDFFQFNGLRPGELYNVSTSGLHARFARTLDTILREYTSAGASTANFNDDIGSSGSPPFAWWNRNSSLNVRANNLGQVFVAVTGYNDFDFDGFEDPADQLRHDENGAYMLGIQHICPIGCLDANGNCIVDFGDVGAILANFGRTCQ